MFYIASGGAIKAVDENTEIRTVGKRKLIFVNEENYDGELETNDYDVYDTQEEAAHALIKFFQKRMKEDIDHWNKCIEIAKKTYLPNQIVKEVQERRIHQKYYAEPSEKWLKEHKGNIEFVCEFCGIYTASEPKCNLCQRDD